MEVCTSNTPSPQAQPMEVCVPAPVPLSSRTLGFGFSLSYVRTYFHRVYVDSIYPLSKESSVCVCGSMSLSLSPSNGGVCAPSPSPSLTPSFPIPFSLYPPLSLYVVLPHVSYPTFYLFLSSYFHLRPQNRESTVSRPICEVKHGID